jgi:S1-C subfamily serine protease
MRDCVYAVVRHRTLPDGSNGAMPIGSGFFIAQDVFLTCYHVMNTRLAPHLDGDRYHLVQMLGSYGKFITIDDAEVGKTILLHPDSDVAILKVKNALPTQRYVALEFGDVPEGVEIGVAGYPLPRLASVNGQLQYDGLIYRVATGVVNSAYKQNIKTTGDDPLITGVDTLEVNFLFVSGNSGGPIFDAETGRVCAFVHGYRSQKIDEGWVGTNEHTKQLGAPEKHVEALHAIYSVGIRLGKVRAQIEALGVTL